MTLKEAMLTGKFSYRRSWLDSGFTYYQPKTGPHKDLVDCDYFVIKEDGEEYFSTSIDLYPEDILAEDYIND